MEYRELAPAPALKSVVRCYWTLRAAAVGAGPPQRVLPDGCVEIVINLGRHFERHHDDGRVERQPFLLAVGPTTRSLTIAPTGTIHLVGIRFAPGGALPFLSVAPHELRDSAPAMEAVVTKLDAGVAEQLADRAGNEAAILDRMLLDRLRRARRRPDSRVHASIVAATADPAVCRVDTLTRLTGLSARQLERQFRASVGFGPKTFCRLMRFQRVVRAVEHGQARLPRLASLAARAGYADQAHMAREFRDFAGTTLTAYVAELHPLSDHFHSAPLAPEADW